MNASDSVEAGPYDLAPRGEATGDAVLCVHGLTGTPYEVRPLAEALAERGLRARGPLLPGHDATPDELSRVSYREWAEAVRAEFAALRGEHPRVFVCGLSLGGLLTLWLAANEPVAAAAVIGTPLRFRRPLPTVVALGRFLRPMLPKKGGSDIVDEAARARHPGMSVMPTSSVHQLIGLQREVRGSLVRIRAPLLVAHGARDRTANPADLHAIAGGVSSRTVERLELAASGHVVPVDVDGPQLASAVADFFSRVVRDAD